MKIRLYIACMAVVMVIAACAEREPPSAVEDTVFADQVKALEKGKSVEGIVEEQARKQREAIEAAEGGSSADN
jgi:phosphosulfolactate phosphohydrolase-like enzyme